MSVRSVIVRLEAEVASYVAGMGRAAQATQRVGQANQQMGPQTRQAHQQATQAAQAHRDAAEQVGQTATIAGAATVAGVGLAIKTYADFDKQMSSVKAATHETAGNMDLLREAAVAAGADTAFSAVEAAQGIEELAKAGVSTADVLGGGLDGALDLAAAGALEVGTAAEIAASAMTQFKLSGDQIPHLADLLAAGAGKAQGSVEDLGAALNQSGLVAASTGLTIEETTGALASFASAGLTGSDAGTSFKTMLMALNPNSEAAAKAMKDLGLSAYDAEGNFIGMSEYAGVLQNSLKDMSDEQRNATLKTIFGSDAVRAANVLYEQGADGIQKWEDAVNDAGYAAETAAMMQDNLAGDLEKLGGAFDTVLLQSGSGANAVLRDLVQGLEGFLDAVGKVPAPVLSAATGFAAVLGGAALLGGGLITVIPKIRDTRDALNTLAPAGSRARGAMEKLGKAAGVAAGLAAVTTALAKLAEADYLSKVDTGMGKVADALADVATESPDANAALDGLFKDRDGGELIGSVTDLGSAIKRTFSKDAAQSFNDFGEGFFNTVTGVKGSSHMLADSFDRLDQGLAGLVSGGKAEDAAAAFDKIKAAAEEQGVSVDELKTKFPEYEDALKAASAESKNAAADGEAAAGAIEGVGAAAAGAAPTAEEIAESLAEVGVNAEGAAVDLVKFTDALLAAGLMELSARDAARGFEEAIDAVTTAATNNGKTLDTNTEKGRANEAALDGIASAGFQVVKANAANGESQKTLQGNLKTTYDSLVAGAKQFGLTDDEAIALARDILKVPPKVNINSWMSSEAKRMAEATESTLNRLDGKTVRTYVIHTERNNIENVVTTSHGKNNTGGRQGTKPTFQAEGGAIHGPGTGTSDDVPAWLSNGEHVLTAREVELMGGQQAVYRFRQQVKTGSIAGFASGGAVGTRAAATQLMMHQISSAAGPTGPMEMVGTLELNADATKATFRGMALQQATSAIAAADAQTKYSRKGR